MSPLPPSERSNRISTRQDGVAMLELALLLPILVLFFSFGVDASRLLGSMQVAGAFSRELVNFGYRNCSGESESDLGPCLELVHQELAPQAERVQPGTELIVSAFEFDSANNRYERLAQFPEPGPLQQPSRIGNGPENSIQFDELDTGPLQPSARIIVGEVQVPFIFLLSGSPGARFLQNDGFTYQISLIAN